MIVRPTACIAALLLVCAVTVGCDPPDSGSEPAEIALRPMPGGRILYDSAILGAHQLMEIDTNRMLFRRVLLRQVCLSPGFLGRCLKQVAVVDGLLVGSDDDRTYTGADLVGSRWDFEFDTAGSGNGDGILDSSASLRLSDRSLVTVPGEGALELIDFRVDRSSVTGPLALTLPPGSGPLPLCAADPARGNTTAAALLGDISVDPDDGSMSARPNTLHIACTSAALGRTTALGYRPDDVGLEGFEGMVRALSADYCGTGHSFVTGDDPFAVADVWGIHTTSEPLREARWSSAGALCLDQVRDPQVDAAAIRQACGIPLCDDGPLGEIGEIAVTSQMP